MQKKNTSTDPTDKKYLQMCERAAKARASRSAKNKLPETIAARFWSKVDKRGPDECWPWTAGRIAFGYGHFRLHYRKINASRYAYILTNGPISDEILVCHECDNPPCCNPKHLFLGTHKDNAQDCIKKGRSKPPSGESHGMAKLTDEKVKEIRQRYTNGERMIDLALEYEVTKTTIIEIVAGTHWLKVTGGISVARKIVGENHPRSRLSEEQVIAIRAYYAKGGVTMYELGDSFGVCWSTVWAIVNRKSWKHI